MCETSTKISASTPLHSTTSTPFSFRKTAVPWPILHRVASLVMPATPAAPSRCAMTDLAAAKISWSWSARS